MRPLALSALLCSFVATAQTPIADARLLPTGTTVTVRGIVTNGGELGGIRYVQDATGGIALFPGAGSQGGFAPPRGADVTATGVLKLFNGLLELDPITAWNVHATGEPLPVPAVIAPQQMGEANESELVRMTSCTFMATGDFTAGTTPFTGNGQSGVIYLRSGHPLVGTAVPSGPVDLVGIVSQYSTSVPPVGGYQLLPRDAADLMPATGIAIIGPAQQHTIVPDGFTLQWTTNIGGTSQVAFGPTPALGQFAAAAGTTTAHDVALTGLPPASFHYARAFSVADGDTAWAPLGLYSTASAVPGHVRAYFNKSVDHDVALTVMADVLPNAFDDTVRAHIDAAAHTVDYAVYNTTFAGIAVSLNAARDRGVQVRVIAEGGTGNSALDDLHPDIPVLYRTDGQGSGMHNKFIVIDAEAAALARTITGSKNMTPGSFFSDANNLVIVHDQALARGYRAEFNEMWGGDGPLPDPVQSRFGPAKTDDTPHLYNVGGDLVEAWFSPSDGTAQRIAQALGTADHSVEFALFAFTHYDLADALIDAQDAGAMVRGIIEGDDMSTGLFDHLQDGGVIVAADQMPAYLHHKYAIVDRAHPTSAPVVITGSHNWSYNADNLNDENTLIMHSAAIADQYYQEWHARWGTSVGITAPAGTPSALRAWPNPARDVLRVQGDGAGRTPAELHVVDALGRTVHTATVAGTGPWNVPVAAFAPGTYVIVVRQAHGAARAVFVRE
ncbi:MAG: phospholipase D-like domain-containing protein [Flavobacteriales bacterium]|jgi:hypothetical protein|nr:phospholipase D-like domain-containing protein [Flavobacteriales bacterium]